MDNFCYVLEIMEAKTSRIINHQVKPLRMLTLAMRLFNLILGSRSRNTYHPRK